MLSMYRRCVSPAQCSMRIAVKPTRRRSRTPPEYIQPREVVGGLRASGTTCRVDRARRFACKPSMARACIAASRRRPGLASLKRSKRPRRRMPPAARRNSPCRSSSMVQSTPALMPAPNRAHRARHQRTRKQSYGEGGDAIAPRAPRPAGRCAVGDSRPADAARVIKRASFHEARGLHRPLAWNPTPWVRGKTSSP